MGNPPRPNVKLLEACCRWKSLDAIFRGNTAHVSQQTGTEHKNETHLHAALAFPQLVSLQKPAGNPFVHSI
jgi:hypothetical protein